MPAPTNPPSRPLFNRVAPLLLGLALLAFYLVTQTRDLQPGLPTRILNSVCGYDPIPVTNHQLYLNTARLFAAALPGPADQNLNLLSALLGALCVAMVFRMTLVLLQPVFPRTAPHGATALRLGALLAAALFGVSVPVWHASTGPDDTLFGIAMLLACFYFVERFAREEAGRWNLLAAGLLYGVTMTEYATAIPLAPVFLAAVLIALLRRGRLNAGHLTLWGLCVLAGLLAYGLGIRAVAQSPDWGYGQFGGPWEVLVEIWRRQWREIRAGLPRVGGLLILLSCFVPWAYIFLMAQPRRSQSWLTRLSIDGSFLVLTGLGVFVLMEGPISPFQLLSGQPVALPYLSVAIWMGLLAGYWWSKPGEPQMKTTGLVKLLDVLWRVVAVACLFLPIALTAFNFGRQNRMKPHPICTLARNAVASMDDARVFVTAGSVLDDMILFALRQAGRDTVVISQPNLSQPPYRAWLASVFATPAVRDAVAAQNVSDLVLAIISGFPRSGDVMFQRPEMPFSLGFQPVPNGLANAPAVDFGAIDKPAFFENNQHLFDTVFPGQIQAVRPGSTTNSLHTAILMEYSRCANNVGVTALFMGEAGQAQSYFDRALDYFPQNPNALLNLRTIVLKKQSEADADAADAFREQANQLLREAQQSAQALRLEGADPLRLAGAFGFVYSESFSLWAATQYARAGNPRLQMAALAQARAINPDSEGVHFGEASVAIGAGEVEKAMAEYEAVLKADPDSIPGRIGLAVLLHSQGQTTRALDVLEADETNLDTTRLLSARAMLHAEAGHLDAAKQLFLAAMARKDRDSQSNGFLAIAAFRLGDIENTRALAESTLAREPHLTNLMRILVIVEKNDGKLQRALTWLRLLRAQSPKNVSLLEEIIDVSMRLNDASEAQQASESLLALDPGNFLAHFALAILADQKDAYSVAEKHLRACLQHPDHPTYPRVVNNLAYCLIQQGRAADALPLARQAVQLDSTNANCFHTLAHAQWLGGNLAEAEEAILHARILAPGDPNHQVLHAEILLAAGRKDEARELAAKTITSAQDKWRTRAQKVLDEAGP